ncbi:MAG TPA: hypothetical protein VGR62_19605 [Candidatus Binatia bacterium]|jgi:hypothetical protein|nr:hypothetical protein [Candidatus Binatia bacterium]
MMTLDRLHALLDAHGAAPERWPDGERDAALALIAASPAARALQDDAALLDALLDDDVVEPPSAALVARIVAAAPAPARRRARVIRPTRWLVPLALAAGLALWFGRPVEQPVPAIPIAALGVYEVGSDELLALSDVEPLDTDAWTDCPDDVLGCPAATPPSTEPLSGPSTDERRIWS